MRILFLLLIVFTFFKDITSIEVLLKSESTSSQLSASEKDELQEFYDDKNSYTRYDFRFNYMSHIYSPENSEYLYSVNTVNKLMYIIGGVILGLTLIFMVGRYLFGFFGGKKQSNPRFPDTREMRSTFIFMIIGALLWFSGMIVTCVGGVQFSDSIYSRKEASKESADKFSNLVSISKEDIIKTNVNEFNQNLNLALNPSLPNSYLTIDLSNYPNIEDETNKINSGFSRLDSEFKHEASGMNAWVWIFFSFGIILPGLVFLSFCFQKGWKKKFLNGFQIISLIYITLSGLCFISAGLWEGQWFLSGDFCEQNTNIIANTFPDKGTGVFYFINCLSAVETLIKSNVKAVQTTNYNIFYSGLEVCMQATVNELKKTMNDTQISALKTQVDLANAAASSNSTYLKNLSACITQTSDAYKVGFLKKKNLELSKCQPIKKMAVSNEKNTCLKSLKASQLAYAGSIVQGVAFVIVGITVFKLRLIMLKLFADEEKTVNLRQNRLY